MDVVIWKASGVNWNIGVLIYNKMKYLSGVYNPKLGKANWNIGMVTWKGSINWKFDTSTNVLFAGYRTPEIILSNKKKYKSDVNHVLLLFIKVYLNNFYNSSL